MVFKIIIKPIVFTDAEEAVVYYESKSKGLGERFYKTFLNSIENIKDKPFTYSYVFKTVRRHLLSKFPYKIYYIVLNESIVIIGLSHAKRSNSFVKSRIKLIS